MLERTIRILFLLTGAAVGTLLVPHLIQLSRILENSWMNNPYAAAVIGSILFYSLSLLFAGYLADYMKWMEQKLLLALTPDFFFGIAGMMIGLTVAFLIGFGLSKINVPLVTAAAPLVLTVLLGYLGFSIGFQKREEIIISFSDTGRREPENTKEEAGETVYKLLDASVILDGRIVDISAAGFLEGVLIIPQFILTKLQHIADSSDSVERTRGRRGLDIVKRLQSERADAVWITEESFNESNTVDLKLVHAAKKMGGQVVTTDFGLKKVCELHQIPVLDINDLFRAIKPVMIQGENIHVAIIKKGKEKNQGVAFLDEGTMIVVENGKKFIGQSIDVTVTSILQTSAGRTIFARPYGELEN